LMARLHLLISRQCNVSGDREISCFRILRHKVSGYSCARPCAPTSGAARMEPLCAQPCALRPPHFAATVPFLDDLLSRQVPLDQTPSARSIRPSFIERRSQLHM
jgi:hypothetical protein